MGHRRRLPLPAVPAVLRGLRPRLVLAFLLVALVSVGAATAASYRAARNAVLTAAQDPVMDETRRRLTDLAPGFRVPATQQELDDAVTRITRPGTARPQLVVMVYQDLQARQETGGGLQIPAALREQVHTQGDLRFQRFTAGGLVYFAYGMPVLFDDETPSGIEVYVVRDLERERLNIEELNWSTVRWTAPALLAAVLLALLAAQGVLRPVRELRRAAQQLAEGKLETRLRVRGADELTELARTFNHTAAELEYNVGEIRRMESNARRFVADVSHELRTPLAAMTAVTDTLDEEAGSLHGDAAIAAALVSAETRRLAQLVDNLIEITRFDAGRAELRIDGDADLAAVVRATIAARGWTEQVVTVLPAGVTAEVDRRRVDVIVANLIGNALRHGRPPVTVRVATGPAAPSRPGSAEDVIVQVTDCGPGLPEGSGTQVFERFFKADSARSRSEGSGLGLAIALENARLHGGTIDAGNLPGGGAAFRLTLPRRQPGAAHV